jgi:hypothetical protein
MSADTIRNIAQRRYQESLMKARSGIAIGAVLCAMFAWAAFNAHGALAGAGWGILSLWCAYFGYHSYHWLWPHPLAEDAAFGPSLLFYRTELERRRDYFHHEWLRSGLPFCFLGLGLVVVPPLIRSPWLWPNGLPFFVLLAGWLVAYIRLRARGRQKLQQEIDALRAFERENI